MSTDGTPIHLAPRGLVRDVTSLDLRMFMARYGDAPMLLVRTPDGDAELELGLSASNPGSGRSAVAKPLPFRTTHQAGSNDSRHLDESRRDAPDILRQLMGKNAYFAVPLRKREGSDAMSMGRVSVGRTHNKDLVLRHPSVSKFHAWFELDESDAVYMSDAGSTNLTRLNGQPLEPRTRTAVQPGDMVQFGAVEAVLCSSETLWVCLNRDRPSERSAK